MAGPAGPLHARPSAPRSGQPLPPRIARFRVRGLLGQGAMGVVYDAIDEELGRPVALKLVNPSSRSASRQRRLLREAQALAQLAHPNVVGIYDVGTVEGALFIAMERVAGQDLDLWLRARHRPWAEVLDVFRQAGEGIAAAHAADLIHRDFKPANVLIGDDGRVRVADFGLARQSDEKLQTRDDVPQPLSASVSATGSLVGTPAYMAPELLDGGSADALSDQYSFCVALYEALYGHRPSLTSTGERRSAKPGALEPAAGTVPAWVRRAVLRGLAHRDERWPSMDALLVELDLDRRRRRRRNAFLALSSALTLGALVTLASLRTPPDLCRTGDALAESWSAPTRAALVETLSGLDLADPGWTAQVVSEGLDDYARRWQAGRVDACEATHVDGRQSEALMDARMRCLDGRRAQFEALVEVLGEADDKVGERAIEALNALPPVDRCADLEHVNASNPPPDDPLSARALEGLRTQTAQVLALQRTGSFSAASALAQTLPEQAERLGYAPMLAEIGLIRGALLDDLGEGQAAQRTLEQAYFDAEACGAFDLSQAAALRLVHVCGYRLGELDDAERWAQLADAKIVYNDDPGARVGLWINRGESLEAAGELDDALAAYERAASLHREHPDTNPLQGAEIDDDLGILFTELGRYEDAERVLTRARATWTKLVGPAHPLAARGLNSLGILFMRTGQYAQSAEAFEGALDIWTRTKGPDSDDVAAMHSNLGVTYRRMDELERARAHLERALTIRERNEDSPGLASTLGNLAAFEFSQSNFEVARAAFARGLELRERTYGPDDVKLATMLQGMGQSDVALGRALEGLVALERALALREANLPPGHPYVVAARSGVIETLLELERVPAARALLDENLAAIAARPAQEAAVCKHAAVQASVHWAEGEGEAAHRDIAAGMADCRANNPEGPESLESLARWLTEHPLTR